MDRSVTAQAARTGSPDRSPSRNTLRARVGSARHAHGARSSRRSRAVELSSSPRRRRVPANRRSRTLGGGLFGRGIRTPAAGAVWSESRPVRDVADETGDHD
jgi:hypothetical protein